MGTYCAPGRPLPAWNVPLPFPAGQSLARCPCRLQMKHLRAAGQFLSDVVWLVTTVAYTTGCCPRGCHSRAEGNHLLSESCQLLLQSLQLLLPSPLGLV